MGDHPNHGHPNHGDRQQPWARARRLTPAARAVYEQISAVLATIGLAALIGQLFRLDWRGIIAEAVEVWELYVGGLMGWILHYIVTVPLDWIGVDFETPLWLRTYLAVGLVLSASIWRQARDWAAFGIAPIWPVITIAGFGFLFLFKFRPNENPDDQSREILLSLAPLGYLTILLILNYTLL